MHRFSKVSYPSYTGGVVAVPLGGGRSDVGPLRSIVEERQPELDQLQLHAGPLISGDVWIAFDHTARLLDALREAGRVCSVPCSAGPKGRGYMPVLAGLAVVKVPPILTRRCLIDIWPNPNTDSPPHAASASFRCEADFPPDTEPGIKMPR